MKRHKFSFSIIILSLLLVGTIVFNLFTYVTKENQYSVVKQFGKIVSTSDTAGLRTKIPFIQNVTHISKATRLYDLNPSEIITSDKKSMILDAYVLWNVTDAKLFTSTLNASSKTAQSRLDVIVFNAIKTTVSSMTQDEIINSRSNLKKIEAVDVELDDLEINDYDNGENTEEDVNIVSISDKLLTCIGDQCDQYGIQITDIEIKILDLPDENKEAVYNRMITERNNIATAYKAQGQSAAQIIRNQTDAEVSVMLSEANANAEKVIAEGEAEYMKILADAYNNPEKADFYLYSLQLDSLKESLSGKNNTLIIDKNSPFANIFNGVPEDTYIPSVNNITDGLEIEE